MRWLKILKHHAVNRRPILRVTNPRIGTSIIPLGKEDHEIFFQYLTNKVHSLNFEGTEGQLNGIINNLKKEQGFTIQKMRTSIVRDGRIMLLHIKFPNEQEIRRVIKLF